MPVAEHPAWCDPEHCDESDHRSTPATIEGVRVGEPDIGVQLLQPADEPLDTAPQTVLITFDASYTVPDIRAYDLEPHQVLALLSGWVGVQAHASVAGVAPLSDAVWPERANRAERVSPNAGNAIDYPL